MTLFFRDVNLDGRRVDLRVDGDLIGAIGEVGSVDGRGLPALQGGMITAPTAEPHVHLDAALLGVRAPNHSGTLREGIRNWAALRDGLTRQDVLDRARTVVGWYRRHGTLRIRTHVDTGCPVAVHALLELREALAGEVELQVVAFPQEGILRRPGLREGWEDAVACGCDAVGAIPHFERTTEEGWQSVRLAYDLAEKYRKKVDFHCDETDDPGSRNLEVVCAEAIDRGFGGRVVAGHCTALHSYPNPYAAKVCELVATSGVQVVANPLDNVVLQGRYDAYPKRRGVTRVDALWAAGATVGIGHDSVIDPWYPLGTANLLDAAYMLVHVAHLTSTDEMGRVFRTLSEENHLPFGDVPRIAAGEKATFLWYAAADPIEALRTREQPRVYVRGGQI